MITIASLRGSSVGGDYKMYATYFDQGCFGRFSLSVYRRRLISNLDGLS
jgi:hypothetical protein